MGGSEGIETVSRRAKGNAEELVDTLKRTGPGLARARPVGIWTEFQEKPLAGEPGGRSRVWGGGRVLQHSLTTDKGPGRKHQEPRSPETRPSEHSGHCFPPGKSRTQGCKLSRGRKEALSGPIPAISSRDTCIPEEGPKAHQQPPHTDQSSS